MDKIILKNLSFYGYHGVMKEEMVLGQKFFIDVELNVDLKEAGLRDDLYYTVNYGEVYKNIEKIVTSERYDLIEALGEKICDTTLTKFPQVEEIWIYIKKPEAPVPGIYDHFGIQMRRKRNA